MTEPSDAERYPTLTDDGKRMLQRLREHRHAPMFRNESGNRLTREDVETVRAFEREVSEAVVAASEDGCCRLSVIIPSPTAASGCRSCT